MDQPERVQVRPRRHRPSPNRQIASIPSRHKKPRRSRRGIATQNALARWVDRGEPRRMTVLFESGVEPVSGWEPEEAKSVGKPGRPLHAHRRKAVPIRTSAPRVRTGTAGQCQRRGATVQAGAQSPPRAGEDMSAGHIGRIMRHFEDAALDASQGVQFSIPRASKVTRRYPAQGAVSPDVGLFGRWSWPSRCEETDLRQLAGNRRAFQTDSSVSG